MLSTLLWRSLRQHAAGAVVAALSVALSCGLLLCVWQLRQQASDTFASYSGGYDAVVGARSSKLQVVLNAVFHLENAPGTVGKADFEALSRNPLVREVIPMAAGDSYHGWRIVGTTETYLGEQGARDAAGRSVQLRSGGRLFKAEADEAVLGSLAAAQVGLKLGDAFHPSHGTVEQGAEEHQETYTVVGILEPTNTPLDRVIWIPLHGLQTMSGHDASHAEDMTAVLLRFRSPAGAFMLDRQLNREGSRLTLAYPIGSVVAELFSKFAWIQELLGGIAWLVALVAAGSVFACISATLAGRRRELAILRALGAGRRTLFGLMLGESLVIGFVGALLGYAVFAVLGSLAAWQLQARTGIHLEIWHFSRLFLWAPLGTLCLCALAGLLPACQAYRLSVVEALAPEA